MSIKIGSKIEKLNPADTYKLVDGTDVDGFDTLKGRVDQHEVDRQGLDSRMGTAEQHLQTLQQDGIAITARVTATETGLTAVNAVAAGNTAAIQKVHEDVDVSIKSLESNIAQKISGLHIEDVANNVFNDINALHFIGATASYDGHNQASITVDPTFNVSNGQTAGSVNFDVEDLEFPGATITTRNNGKIAVVGIQAGSSGVDVTVDGTTYNDKTAIEFEDFTAAEQGGKLVLTPTKGPQAGGTLNIADALLDVGSANKLEFLNGKILEDGTGGVQYTPYVTGANQGGGYEQYNAKQFNAVWPLKFEAAKSGPNTVTEDEAMIVIDPMAYEPMHKPSFLAYIGDDTEIIGKGDHGAKGHHDGTLWFDNVIVPHGAYIEADRNNKKFGIQESDALDPNVSGGTDYLLVFRIHMKGVASEDGIVQMYLYNASINPYEPTGYLMDVNGQPCMVQKHFKNGDELGVMQLTAVVNAKGMQEFTCHVVDTFVADTVILTDRTEGCSGLMIQSITSEWKTGDGLQQFELDTQQNIEFSSHYLGASRMDLGWIIAENMPMQVGGAGEGQTMADGWSFYNLSQMKIGVEDGRLILTDDGSHIADFHFGKIFSAEETQMLRGHDVNVSVTLTDRDMGWNVALMKWTGKPDEYTEEIFKSRNNNSLILESGWAEVSTMFISEDAVSGDHTLAKTFPVPTDANNYAVVIYPIVAQMPMTLKLKQFKLDVDPPFIGYAIKEPQIVGEAHLANSVQHKTLVQNTHGYDALRYTIGNTEIPMPPGEMTSGAADITLDASTNIVTGSQAKGGEGSLQFNVDGDATITTALNIWSEQSPEITSSVQFWWAKVADGVGGQVVYNQIPESLTTFQVKGGTKALQVTMKPITVKVATGDKLALRAKADRADGAFLECVTDATPLVKTAVTFNEVVATGYDDPFSGIDMSSFTNVRYGFATADIDFFNKSSINVQMSIPDDVDLVVLSAIKENQDLSVESVARLGWKYFNATKTLSISFGETVPVGRVILGISV